MNIKKGIYEHYKGNRYRVIALAKHSESHEDMVVYQNIADSNKIWVRPLAMFMEKIEFNGEVVARFKYIGK